MQPLQITFHGIGHSDAIERRVRRKAAELERFYDRIISCRVTVDAQHKRHHQGNLYAVRVDLRLPDKEIVVGHESPQHQAHEDVYVAIRDAFGAAVRRLEDYARERRHQVKRHETPDHGRVVKLFSDDGYGFVERADGSDVYFNEHSVVGAEFASLAVGDEVRIVVAEGEGEKGPQASTVIPIGKHHLGDEATSS
jgi:cold shock CspA family protein